MAVTEPTWAKEYRGRFKAPFGFDAEGWERIMRADIPEWKEYRLTEVMAWMQSQGQKWPKSPNARDLVTAMRTRAKGARVDDEPPTSHCAVCRGHGIATAYPDVPAGGFKTPDDVYLSASTSVPCACSAGDRAIARSATWSATGRTPKLDGLAAMAVRQHAEIEQMWRDAPPADMDAPTVDALAGAVTQTFRDRDAGEQKG